jgi:hypothetical protein
LIITLVFEKNAKFFAENWEKSQKIVIITSTPEKEAFDQVFTAKIFCFGEPWSGNQSYDQFVYLPQR